MHRYRASCRRHFPRPASYRRRHVRHFLHRSSRPRRRPKRDWTYHSPKAGSARARSTAANLFIRLLLARLRPIGKRTPRVYAFGRAG